MKITPFSIIIILVSLFLLFRNKNKDLLSLFRDFFIFEIILSININVGYFIEISNSQISYESFISIIVFIIAVFAIIFNIKFDFKLAVLGCALLLSIACGFIIFAFWPYQGGIVVDWDNFILGNSNLTYGIQLSSSNYHYIITIIKYVTILCVAKAAFTKNKEWGHALAIVYSFSKITLIYGIFELFSKKVFAFNLTENFLDIIFGRAESTYDLVDRMQGFNKESSHFSITLFFIGVMSILNRIINKNSCNIYKGKFNDSFALLTTFILMLFSTSFSSIIFMAILVIMLFVFLLTKKQKYLVVFGLVIFVLLLILIFSIFDIPVLNNYYSRLIKVFSILKGENVAASSELIRVRSIIEMFNILFKRPIFGIGAGFVDAHAAIPAILANFGLIGTSLWIIILYRFSNLKNKNGLIFILLIICSISFVGAIGYIALLKYPFILAVAGYVFMSTANYSKIKSKKIVC